MKTTVKLILIYLAMQFVGAFVVTPFTLAYSHIKYGDLEKATDISMVPAFLMGLVFMMIYLWRAGYLTGDKRMYSPVSESYLLWSAAMGISVIFIVDFLMSYLTFLPDFLDDEFEVLQSTWLGIACIGVLGPILEEFLFRGAITKALLKKYKPVTAILISGLVFGIFHLNPAQIVGATLIGFVLGWIYYKTRSVIPCILIHILNNSLSVYLSMRFPDVEYTSDLIGARVYPVCVILSVGLFLLSWRMMNTYKLSDTTAEV
ncbi:CPBP family intramembrane glutamic endopeptidase [Bacteroides sp. UBA939]|uniref:CPBP family intramembrane glutamic endopeptidase n=1 Tax=Bacteroides sp. UBA939 TaxID=1946092 RepID=UPI0025C58327|nr:type II CAAX endopeptidase family protein [Bacteroides sp. UBA939]